MNSPKLCDHTSVGMLVWQDEKLLLIERKKIPFGFAPPAGHVDKSSSYEDAARRELKEEVGLQTQSMKLVIEGRKDTCCRREGGTWHYWKIFIVETSGEIERSKSETKQARFYSRDDLMKLTMRTTQYLGGEIPEVEWEHSPGLEPVWYEWLHELRII